MSDELPAPKDARSTLETVLAETTDEGLARAYEHGKTLGGFDPGATPDTRHVAGLRYVAGMMASRYCEAIRPPRANVDDVVRYIELLESELEKARAGKE